MYEFLSFFFALLFFLIQFIFLSFSRFLCLPKKYYCSRNECSILFNFNSCTFCSSCHLNGSAYFWSKIFPPKTSFFFSFNKYFFFFFFKMFFFLILFLLLFFYFFSSLLKFMIIIDQFWQRSSPFLLQILILMTLREMKMLQQQLNSFIVQFVKMILIYPAKTIWSLLVIIFSINLVYSR